MGLTNHNGQILIEVIFSLTLFISLLFAFNMLSTKSQKNSIYLTKPIQENIK